MNHPTGAIANAPHASAARFARVMPLAFITYSLAYLDRLNIGFGGAGGMRESLGFSTSQFAYFYASFFIGYMLFQIPGAGYAARHSVKWLLFWALLCWGILASATALLHDYHLLLLDRFLLGAVEGAVFPSLLVFLTHWFTRGERSRANTVLILGNPLTVLLGSLVSGTLVAYFDRHLLLHLRGWQMMLLLEGLPTLVWAVIWLWIADDRPTDAAWLAPADAASVQAVLDDEQKSVKAVKNYWAAFGEPRVILISALFFAWSVGIYGLNMWLPLILIQGSKMGIARVGVMNAVPYLFGAVAMLIVSTLSDKTLIRRAFVWPFLLVGAAAFFLSYLAGAHFWLSFAGLTIAAACMYAPYGPFWAMIPEMISRNVIGESLALINTIGAAGGYIGTLGVPLLKDHFHSYGVAFAFLSACLAAAGLMTIAIRMPRASTAADHV